MEEKVYTRFCLRAFSALHAITTIALAFGCSDVCLALSGLPIDVGFNIGALACLIMLSMQHKKPAKSPWYVAIILIFAAIASTLSLISMIVQLISCFSTTCDSGTIFKGLLAYDHVQCSKGFQLATVFVIFSQLSSLLYGIVMVL